MSYASGGATTLYTCINFIEVELFTNYIWLIFICVLSNDYGTMIVCDYISKFLKPVKFYIPHMSK